MLLCFVSSVFFSYHTIFSRCLWILPCYVSCNVYFLLFSKFLSAIKHWCEPCDGNREILKFNYIRIMHHLARARRQRLSFIVYVLLLVILKQKNRQTAYKLVIIKDSLDKNESRNAADLKSVRKICFPSQREYFGLLRGSFDNQSD